MPHPAKRSKVGINKGTGWISTDGLQNCTTNSISHILKQEKMNMIWVFAYTDFFSLQR